MQENRLITTTVAIPLELYEWAKVNDHKLRGVMMAGMEYLKGAPSRAGLEHDLRMANMEIRRLKRYHDMVNWAFHNDPEGYSKMSKYIWSVDDETNEVAK